MGPDTDRKILWMYEVPENLRGTLKTALTGGPSGLESVVVNAMTWDEAWPALVQVSDGCMHGAISVTCS